jgi:hypothetical protein
MKSIEITLTRDKECKGSVRFAAPDPKAAITNVYVSRDVAEINSAKQIKITVQIGD